MPRNPFGDEDKRWRGHFVDASVGQTNLMSGDESDPFGDDHLASDDSDCESDHLEHTSSVVGPVVGHVGSVVGSVGHVTPSLLEHSAMPHPTKLGSGHLTQTSAHSFSHLNEPPTRQVTEGSVHSFRHLNTESVSGEKPDKPVVPARPGRSPNPFQENSSPELRPALPPRPSVSVSPSPERTLSTQLESNSSLHSNHSGSEPPPLPRRKPLHSSEPSLFAVEERLSQVKVKDITLVPITTFSNRRLPTVESLSTTEFHHKGPIKAFAFSGLYAATGTTNVRIWYLPTGENIKTLALQESKVYSLAFVPNVNMDLEGHCLWVGIDKGEMIEVDVRSGDVLDRRLLHTAPVTHMLRQGAKLYSLDENGSFKIWSPNEFGTLALSNRPRALRVSPKQSCAHVVGAQLWTSLGKQVEVYSLDEESSSVFLKRFDVGSAAAGIGCIGSLPSLSQVYLGHDDGKITIYDVHSFERRRIVHLGMYKITCILGLPESQHLWVGFGTGKMAVYDPSRCSNSSEDGQWLLLKDFQSYVNSGVSGILHDVSGLEFTYKQNIVTVSEAGHCRIWDGLLIKDRLDALMKEKTGEYCTHEPIKAVMMTWNIDSRKPSDLDLDAEDRRFIPDFLNQHAGSDIYVFAFQELVDLESKSENAKQLLKAANASKEKATLDQRFLLWQDKLVKEVCDAYGSQYRLLESRQLVGLFLCVFIKPILNVTEVAPIQVKTGLGGFHGNKGALAIRLILEQSSICFVNSHLAAHQSHISGRNSDIASILKDAQFPKVPEDGTWEQGGDGTMILDHENVFWMGDLNYRLDLPRPAVIQRIEKREFSYLWEFDQLCRQKADNPAFGLREFQEGKLEFAPTFKYDRGTFQYDTSDKQRIPAYCDRILWRGPRISQTFLDRYECKISDHRPVGAAFIIHVKRADRTRQNMVYQQCVSRLEEFTAELLQRAKVYWTAEILNIDTASANGILESCSGNLKNVLDVYVSRQQK